MMIWGLLRLKNEARWIQRVVESIRPLCSEIIVLDDHSDDGTPEICEQLRCHVFRSEFDTLHERRDKDFLLARIWKMGAQLGDYCIMIDGDEVLVQEDIPRVQHAIKEDWACCSFQVLYLWDREDQIRIDRWYANVRRPSMFQLTSHELSFSLTKFGGNLHCSSAPAQLLRHTVHLPVRLLHYGYLYREDRIRKFRWYNTVDPNDTFEDHYRHMVIGDLPEFPANSSFKWAGPLELRPL